MREFLLAVVSGGCLVLAFPPVDAWPVAMVALIPLFYVISRSRRPGFWNGFRPGFVAGVTFFLLLLFWLAFLSSNQMNNPVVMSGPLVLLVLLQSFFWGMFSATASFVGSRTRLPWFVILPVLWVAFEQLRSLGVVGFTWGALGYAAVTVPRAIQFASITGLFGISLWLALCNALVLEALMGRKRVLAAAAVVVAVVLPFVHGSLVLAGAAGNGTTRVAVIQPNIPGLVKWESGFKGESFDTLARLSYEAAEQHPDLIVWPETAAPSYLLYEPADLAFVRAVAESCGAAILTGCPNMVPSSASEGAGRALNSALLIGPYGDVRGVYSKMKLVPFGEAIPFETVLPLLKNVDFGEADFWPGDEHVVFDENGRPFSTLICYEAIFPRLARQFAADGAAFFVNITNDVWYGRSPMPYQHAAMAVMRTVENRRSLARSANSGISMMVDPYGRVLEELPIFEEGFIVADLPMLGETTFYTSRGDVFPWSVVLAGAVMLGAGLSRGQRGGHASGRRV
jgi:apolipoprotein N-acyltransferase